MAAPAFAYRPSYTTPDKSDFDNHHGYVNRDGLAIHLRSGRVPEGQSPQYRDGTYSFSRHHSGIFSRNGGVGRWL